MKFESAVLLAAKELSDLDHQSVEANEIFINLVRFVDMQWDTQIDEYIDRSKFDCAFWDGISIYCAENIQSAEKINPSLRSWMKDLLLGKRRRPPVAPHERKGRKGDVDYRNLLIWHAVRRVIDQGFKATRNETSPPQSAVDVVAAAMKRLNKTPNSYDGIKAIYLKRERREKESLADWLKDLNGRG